MYYLCIIQIICVPSMCHAADLFTMLKHYVQIMYHLVDLPFIIHVLCG